MSYYVGNDRIEVETMRDAYKLATRIMFDRKLGDSVNVYRNILGNSIEARIEVRPDRNGVLRYVVYRPRNRYARALSIDYLPKGEKFTNIHP